MRKYDDPQTRVLLAHELENFKKFVLQIESENEELFHRYVYRLLLRIYELHLNGRYLTKTRACRLIPLSNQNVCQRYVDEAAEKGFIEIRTNPQDKRKKDIIPKQQLLDYVEERIGHVGDQLRITLAKTAATPLPRDNLPFSGWTAPE